MNLDQLLEFLEEKGDSRSMLLHYAILQRIRHGKSCGTLEDLLGMKAPGAGQADGFLAYRLTKRNENLRKAVYHIVRYEMIGEHAACGLLALKLKRFRGQYQRIAAGKAYLDSFLTQCLVEAIWHDPTVFDLKQGALFKILFP